MVMASKNRNSPVLFFGSLFSHRIYPQVTRVFLFCFCVICQICGLTACQPSVPEAGSSAISDTDGAMIIFIPAGEFLMGSSELDPDADDDEMPQHKVFVSAFWMDRTEVTNAMYRVCVEAGKCTEPARSRRYHLPEYANHPVLGVSWDQAVMYCAWAGRRLPTEAEWEKAARGLDDRLYPWGNESPDASRLNFDHLVDDTMEVGRYSDGASPYGVLDMSGNVWEWVFDGYDESYYFKSPYADPQGGTPVNRRVLRGGSWSTQARNVRVANRFWAFPGRNDTDGFRCALSGVSPR
jgi:formylglycine-generating enzyme required for sulfatase activity